MIGLGYGAGRLLGWTPMESVFTGAILSISSTTIVAKAFEEQEVDTHVRGLCFGILLAEDLVAIVLLALLTAAAAGEALSLRSFSATGGRLLLFDRADCDWLVHRALRYPGGSALGSS
jgi:monovalent cation:H+ antiporter-2, CPA2 family